MLIRARQFLKHFPESLYIYFSTKNFLRVIPGGYELIKKFIGVMFATNQAAKLDFMGIEAFVATSDCPGVTAIEVVDFLTDLHIVVGPRGRVINVP